MDKNQLTSEEIRSLQRILVATGNAIQRAIQNDRIEKHTLDEAWEVYQNIQGIYDKLSSQL